MTSVADHANLAQELSPFLPYPSSTAARTVYLGPCFLSNSLKIVFKLLSESILSSRLLTRLRTRRRNPNFLVTLGGSINTLLKIMFLVLLLFVIALPVFVPRHLKNMTQDGFLGVEKVGERKESR